MSNFRGTKLWAGWWLGLVLLVLVPWEASARRGRRVQDDSDDPICYRSAYGICQKWRVALVGGGILSTEGASTAAGMQLGYAWVLGPRLELGGDLLFMKDIRIEKGPYLGTAEAVLRIVTMAGPNHRAFLQLGLGGSRYESSTTGYWAFPCASGGVAFELSGPGMGAFLSAGLSLMWAEGLAALPHAGVGLVF
jgi:hypothetical protein